ncbi:hypothetical protein F4782DRAFT_528274 [Xylaria castorea]|nr:hypothetical protein F4782DRAFT_528274 [Xylaria castorea]
MPCAFSDESIAPGWNINTFSLRLRDTGKSGKWEEEGVILGQERKVIEWFYPMQLSGPGEFEDWDLYTGGALSSQGIENSEEVILAGTGWRPPRDQTGAFIKETGSLMWIETRECPTHSLFLQGAPYCPAVEVFEMDLGNLKEFSRRRRASRSQQWSEPVLDGQEDHKLDVANYVHRELKIGRSTVAEEIRTEL